jgi:DNA-binding transcriptional LysR family regulator
MVMLDRLTSLEVFAKVAATGSLSAAGRAMAMSQTMVTKHIASLESRLGVKLFHRTTRRLSITEAGRNYLEATTRIVANLEAADSAIAADRFKPRGMLRLNAPVSFGARRLAPLLSEFVRRYPDVTIDLGLNDRIVDLAEEGWDLAIRIGSLTDSSLIARRIAPCRTIVCASPSYLLAHGTPRRVNDLVSHNCLGYALFKRRPHQPMDGVVIAGVRKPAQERTFRQLSSRIPNCRSQLYYLAPLQQLRVRTGATLTTIYRNAGAGPVDRLPKLRVATMRKLSLWTPSFRQSRLSDRGLPLSEILGPAKWMHTSQIRNV